jgi:hypothetical protein
VRLDTATGNIEVYSVRYASGRSDELKHTVYKVADMPQ